MVAASSSEGTARRYGVERVCKVWSMPRSTFYARRKRRTAPCPVRRRGPVGPCPDAELVEHIRNVLKASLFHGEHKNLRHPPLSYWTLRDKPISPLYLLLP